MNMTRIIARASGVRLDDIDMVIRGDIDPSKAFGQDGNARGGFSDLSIALELTPEHSESDGDSFVGSFSGGVRLTTPSATPRL